MPARRDRRATCAGRARRARLRGNGRSWSWRRRPSDWRRRRPELDPLMRIIGGSAAVASTAMNQQLVDHLLKHSVRRGEFTLRSGKQSNWFIDAKQTTCSPDGMLLVADAFLAVLPDDITAVGGLTMGADGVT